MSWSTVIHDVAFPLVTTRIIQPIEGSASLNRSSNLVTPLETHAKPLCRTGLLVSVRDAIEAKIVAQCRAVNIIDLKEPSNGSLGCVSAKTAIEISTTMGESVVLMDRQHPIRMSIALGEVSDGAFWPELTCGQRADALRFFEFVKCGLSGFRGKLDWQTQWANFLAPVPESASRVAVAYIDEEAACSPPLIEVLDAAAEMNMKFLLLDTFGKQQGGLFDWRSPTEIAEIVEQANQRGMNVVLAGSISNETLGTAIEIKPAFVAVRGAVCGSSREDAICCNALRQFAEHFEHCKTNTPLP